MTTNLWQYLETSAARTPTAAAVVFGQDCWDYRRLTMEAENLAAFLWTQGLRPGSRVLALMALRPQAVAVFWAAMRLGLVYVPLNPDLPAADLRYCAVDAEPDAVFYDRPPPPLPSRRQRGPLTVDVQTDYGKVLSNNDASRLPPPPPGGDAIAMLLYTSGVGGRPKGVPRSHRNEIAASLGHIIEQRYRFGEKSLLLAPLAHTMALRTAEAVAMLSGTLYLASDPDPADWRRLIGRHRISALYTFPRVYHDLLQAPGEWMRSIRHAGFAGAPMHRDLVRAVLSEIQPQSFVNHYGSTEVSTFSSWDRLEQKPGCAGKPGLHARLRVARLTAEGSRDPGLLAMPGERGELMVHLSSPEAFRGYWNRSDLTAATIVNGWYFTGDIGLQDDEGDFWVLDRRDDLILTGEHKVYPSDVEEVLLTHPGVAEAVVAGEPNRRMGQQVVAYVVLSDPSLTPAALRQHCLRSGRLAAHQLPQRIRVCRDFPRAGGKPVRRLLVAARGR